MCIFNSSCNNYVWIFFNRISRICETEYMKYCIHHIWHHTHNKKSTAIVMHNLHYALIYVKSLNSLYWKSYLHSYSSIRCLVVFFFILTSFEEMAFGDYYFLSKSIKTAVPWVILMCPHHFGLGISSRRNPWRLFHHRISSSEAY